MFVPSGIPGVAVILPTKGAGDQQKSWDFITWRAGFEWEPVESLTAEVGAASS